jgi:hypothetical protein
MKLPWVLVLIALLGIPGPGRLPASLAAAQTSKPPGNPLLTLRGLLALCERSDPTSTAACGNYITGFIQGSKATQTAAVVEAVAEGVRRGVVAPTNGAIESASAKLHERSNLFCIRSDWTAGYVQTVLVQYGREHRNLLNEMSGDQMLKILAKAFPCGGGK